MRVPKVVRRADYDVLIRALKMRVRNHATERCCCDFCKTYRKLAARSAAGDAGDDT